MNRLFTALLRGRLFRIALGLLAVYAATGFLLVPALVRSQLPPRLSALLHRPVTLRRVRVNPFALSVTLDGLEVRQRDGAPWVGWERLYVNLSARTLATLTPRFKEIYLEGFHARVVLDAKGNPDCADLLQPAAAPPKGPAAPMPEVVIGHLAIVGARLAFLDQATAPPFATTLGPVSLALDGFRLSRDNRNPYTFEGRTEKGETFGWRGHFLLEPLRSAGSFRLGGLDLPKYAPFYRDAVAFELRRGQADFQADYEARFGDGGALLRLGHGNLDLRDLALAEAGSHDSAVVLPRLEARGLDLDLLGATGHLASLTLSDARLRIRRGANGEVDLQRMLTPRPKPAAEPAKPFHFTLDQFRLRDLALAFEDRTPRRPVRLGLDQVQLALDHVSLEPEAPWALQCDARWNGRGRIHAAGQVTPLRSRGAVDLDLEDLDLAPLGAYGAPALAAVLTSARLGLRGHTDFDAQAPARSRFRGQAQLNAFTLVDGATREPILAWKALRAGGLQVDQAPLAVKVATLDWEGPEGHVTVLAPGSTNLGAAYHAPAAGPSPAPGPGLKAELALLRIKGGRLVYLDRGIQPLATLALESFEGQVSGLSTVPGTRAEVSLKALVDGAAPLQVKGRVTMAAQVAEGNLAVTVQGMDLTPMSPYAGRFVGYPIGKGKLALALNFDVARRQLTGENRILMDQFTLGEATGSPDAVHLPVKLGLALLRDRHGLIDLDVPVRGDLDQPDFRLGRVIWHAVLNVFGKLVTSPFTALSHAFGGGSDLSLVSFPPGSAELGQAETKVTDGLAKALYERPGLSLEIEGSAGEGSDGPALRREALERDLARRRAEGLPQPTPQERAELIREAFLEAFPATAPAKPAKDAPALPPAAEMEARLLARPLDPAALPLLARRRARAVRDRLLQAGKVEEPRLFLVDGGVRPRTEPGAKAFFTLK